MFVLFGQCSNRHCLFFVSTFEFKGEIGNAMLHGVHCIVHVHFFLLALLVVLVVVVLVVLV